MSALQIVENAIILILGFYVGKFLPTAGVHAIYLLLIIAVLLFVILLVARRLPIGRFMFWVVKPTTLAVVRGCLKSVMPVRVG